MRERERSVRGFVARRLWVAGEVEGLWVEGSGSKIGSWREGSRSLAKSKACGLKALGRRSVRGFVDRWSQRCDWRSRQSYRRDRFVDWWVRRSAKSKSKAVISEVGKVEVEGSLSFVFACEFGNGLKWKFSLQTISGSKPSKHPVNWK